MVRDRQTDRQTDRPTDRPTDNATYRSAIADKKKKITLRLLTLSLQGRLKVKMK